MPDALDQATLESLMDSLGGDAEFLAELIDTFVEDAPQQVQALRAALAAGNATALVRPAHTLKSSSASLAGLGLAEQCRQLEATAKSGSVEGAQEAVEAIAAELERVTHALEDAKRSFAA